MNSLGLKPWMLKPGNFFFDVREQIQIPLLRELRMMPALHQHLRAAERDGLLDFLVQLIAGDDVGINVFFRAVKRAELAIHIADIGVIDVAIHVVGDDLVAASVEILRLRELTAAVGQHTQFFQRPGVKPRRLGRINAGTAPNLLEQIITGCVVNHGGKLTG